MRATNLRSADAVRRAWRHRSSCCAATRGRRPWTASCGRWIMAKGGIECTRRQREWGNWLCAHLRRANAAHAIWRAGRQRRQWARKFAQCCPRFAGRCLSRSVTVSEMKALANAHGVKPLAVRCKGQGEAKCLLAILRLLGKVLGRTRRSHGLCALNDRMTSSPRRTAWRARSEALLRRLLTSASPGRAAGRPHVRLAAPHARAPRPLPGGRGDAAGARLAA